MRGRKTTRNEQSCISDCIFKYWGHQHRQEDDERREKDYERCLSDCQICG